MEEPLPLYDLRYLLANRALLWECEIQEMTLARLAKEIIGIRTVSESENTKMIAEAFNYMNWAKLKESGIWYIRCI